MRLTDSVLLASAVFVGVGILNGSWKAPLYEISPATFWVMDVTTFLLGPACAIFALFRIYGIRPGDYGVKLDSKGTSHFELLGLSLFLAALLSTIYFISMYITWAVVRPESTPSFYRSIVPQGFLHWPVVLYLAATAGITEEIVYRGLPYLYLRQRFPGAFPRTAYCAVTAVLFGVAHWENGIHNLAAAFVFGLFSAMLFLKLRDLTPLILSHLVQDLWAFG